MTSATQTEGKVLIRYPVRVGRQENGAWWVRFERLPITVIEKTEDAALRSAARALRMYLQSLIEDGLPLPNPPESLRGKRTVPITIRFQ